MESREDAHEAGSLAGVGSGIGVGRLGRRVGSAAVVTAEGPLLLRERRMKSRSWDDVVCVAGRSDGGSEVPPRGEGALSSLPPWPDSRRLRRCHSHRRRRGIRLLQDWTHLLEPCPPLTTTSPRL